VKFSTPLFFLLSVYGGTFSAVHFIKRISIFAFRKFRGERAVHLREIGSGRVFFKAHACQWERRKTLNRSFSAV